MTFYEKLQILLSVGTLGMIGWYTYLTKKLRDDAQEQNKLISKQIESAQESNQLISKQVESAQKSIDLQNQKAEKEARPIFIWGGGNASPGISQVHFTNKGGAIAILETRATGCNFELQPDNFIDHNGTGQFILTNYNDGRVNYVGIKYRTAVGEVRSTVFVFEIRRRTPDVDKTVNFETLLDFKVPKAPVSPVDLS